MRQSKTDTFWIESAWYDRAISEMGDTDQVFEHLRTLTAFNRINTLSAIMNAERGWVGASFSVAEILTCLYFDVANIEKKNPQKNDLILLSKGHAAVMQYACLFGRGIITLDYFQKLNQKSGPQAHTDLLTPGIAANTGSLGQTLSKACGLAMTRDRHVFVILGDGELQEGQNWEAFQTLNHFRLSNVIPIIDRNGIQTDSETKDIKAIPDLEKSLSGFGFEVIGCQGNRIEPIHSALKRALQSKNPTVIIADTLKAAGARFMQTRETKRRGFRWHGPVTRRSDYLRALQDFADLLKSHAVHAELIRFIKTQNQDVMSDITEKKDVQSTGEAFGRALLRLAPAYPGLLVLDADLEKACRLTGFAEKYPERFLEMGIAEQDMVSCAGGLALQGKIPIVNTFAAFYRRAFEQIYVNATEKTKIVYAGHYAGLCYFSDGKSHQNTGDVAMMRSIPGMLVLYPACPEEVEVMLHWYLEGGWDGPVYLRLHRSPSKYCRSALETFFPGYGNRIRQTGGEQCILTAGPHMTQICLEAAERLDKVDVIQISTFRSLGNELLLSLLEYQRLYVIEELFETGGLFDEIQLGLVKLIQPAPLPIIHHRAVSGLTFSTLEPMGLYSHFGLTPKRIAEWIENLWSNNIPKTDI